MTGEIGVDWEQRLDWAALRAYRVARLRERKKEAKAETV